MKVEHEPLSTDLQCYFSCKEVFKKDYQLFLHLKLRHRQEPHGELEKAYAAAHEEIALTRRSNIHCQFCERVVHTCGISRTGLPDSERIRRSSLVLVSLGTYLTSIARTLLQFPLYLLFFMLLYFPVFLYLLLYSVSS